MRVHVRACVRAHVRARAHTHTHKRKLERLAACLPEEFHFVTGMTCVPYSTKGSLCPNLTKKDSLFQFNQKRPSFPVQPMEPSCPYQMSLANLLALAEVPLAGPLSQPRPPDSVSLSLQEGKNTTGHRTRNRTD